MARDSERSGELVAGDLVEVLESGYDDENYRIRTTGGWVSTLSCVGTALLVRCDTAGDTVRRK